MLVEIGKDSLDRQYTAVRYQPGCIADLPWGTAMFDCAVLLIERNYDKIAELCREVAQANTDWIAVAGQTSEEVHDLIDQASVTVGRQKAVGDGSPMTSWHEEALTVDQMAEIAAGLLGGQQFVLVVIVGSEPEFLNTIEALGKRLAEMSVEDE